MAQPHDERLTLMAVDSGESRLARLADVPGLTVLTAEQTLMLLRFANEMAGCYQSPVYLCGSALVTPDPRDIDLRIQLDDAEFALRYGGSAQQWADEGLTGAWTELRWRWSADCTKRTKRAWKLANANVDFQVYPAGWCAARYAAAPRLRLDDMPEEGD